MLSVNATIEFFCSLNSEAQQALRDHIKETSVVKPTVYLTAADAICAPENKEKLITALVNGKSPLTIHHTQAQVEKAYAIIPILAALFIF